MDDHFDKIFSLCSLNLKKISCFKVVIVFPYKNCLALAFNVC